MKLTGASPGWHPPKAQRFIRGITFRKNDPDRAEDRLAELNARYDEEIENNKMNMGHWVEIYDDDSTSVKGTWRVHEIDGGSLTLEANGDSGDNGDEPKYPCAHRTPFRHIEEMHFLFQ